MVVTEVVTGVLLALVVVVGVSLVLVDVVIVSTACCYVSEMATLLRVIREVAAMLRFGKRLAFGGWVALPFFRFGGITSLNTTEIYNTKFCEQDTKLNNHNAQFSCKLSLNIL